jgi:hypothetical protein
MAVCKCELRNDPLCGFCLDDIYCPQCGQQITSVFCDDQRSAGEPILIYPDVASGDFRFCLSLECRGPNREPQVAPAVLDLERSVVEAPEWFERRFERIGERDDGKATWYRLNPRPDLARFGAHWTCSLPINGVPVTLVAQGDFPDTTIEFLACRSPEFAIRIKGDGILPADDIESDVWEVWKAEKLELDLEIEAITAPVHLDRDIGIETNPPFETRIQPALPPHGWLIPSELCPGPPRDGMPCPRSQYLGEGGDSRLCLGAPHLNQLCPGQPWTTKLVVDCSRWEPERRQELALRLWIHSFGALETRHVLRMGLPINLEFPVERVEIEDARYGDHLRSGAPGSPIPPLSIANVGQAPIYLRPPQVQLTDGPTHASGAAGFGLQVAWAGAQAWGEGRLLAPGDQADISLTFDLREIPEGSLGNHETRGFLVISDDLRTWRLPFVIHPVTPRPASERPLAIDFGNPNADAARCSPDVEAAAELEARQEAQIWAEVEEQMHRLKEAESGARREAERLAAVMAEVRREYYACREAAMDWTRTARSEHDRELERELDSLQHRADVVKQRLAESRCELRAAEQRYREVAAERTRRRAAPGADSQPTSGPRQDTARPSSVSPDEVHCTAFAPPSVARGETFLLQVFAHLADAAGRAARLARDFDPATGRRGSTSLLAQVLEGQLLTFDLTLVGGTADTARTSLRWRRRTESVQFLVTAGRADNLPAVLGRVTISLDTVPVGQIAFKIALSTGVAKLPPEPLGSLDRFRLFFISYAAKDRAEVIKRVQMLPRLGKQFRQDLLDLDPGDRWARKLYEFIRECDATLLFWSSNAKASEWVLKECLYCIDVKGIDRLVPVIIELPPPLPPPELAELHMNDKLLYFIEPR